MLGRNGVDSKNILGSVLNVVRAARPEHAWQINGVLVQRDASPRYGVTVQVIRLPNDATPPETVWGRGWDDAVRCAADRATAAILPRTRLCRAPWAGWRRFVMPGVLVEAYEDAVELERDRRYDEALDACRASSMDPLLNLPLRLHIGQLQEKLGLYLDAFGTYQGILAIEKEAPNRAACDTASRPVNGTDVVRLSSRAIRRQILLGGSELADEWRKPAPIDKAEMDRARQAARGAARPVTGGPSRRNSLLPVQTGTAKERSTCATTCLDLKPYDQTASPLPTYMARERQTLLRLRDAFARVALRDLKSVRRRAWTSQRDRRLVLSGAKRPSPTRECIERRRLLRPTLYLKRKPAGEWEHRSGPPRPRRSVRPRETVSTGGRRTTTRHAPMPFAH